MNSEVPAYAKQYALFSGSGSYWLAQETCRKMGKGSSTLIMSKTVNLDEDINKNILSQKEKNHWRKSAPIHLDR